MNFSYFSLDFYVQYISNNPLTRSNFLEEADTPNTPNNMLKLKASHEYGHAFPSHQSDLGPLSFSKISNVYLFKWS